jgi:hypothetical protein
VQESVAFCHFFGVHFIQLLTPQPGFINVEGIAATTNDPTPIPMEARMHLMATIPWQIVFLPRSLQMEKLVHGLCDSLAGMQRKPFASVHPKEQRNRLRLAQEAVSM